MNEQNLDQLRHSTAHLLAAAIMQLYPDAKLTLGPSIENGFYYDIDDLKIAESDFPKIEKVMHKLANTWSSFEEKELSLAEAQAEFAGNPYKLELIQEHSAEKLTVYQSGKFRDLCRGGHVEHPNQDLKYFKLLSVAGAYWRGDEKNKMLTRIYGTAFYSQAELDAYVTLQEEAKKRDHRKLGVELDLFAFSDLVGKGLPMLTPRGATIRRELERFVVDEEIKRGYQHVVTPPLAKVDLYRKSGHYPYYKDTMYPPMIVDEDELILRPMTCPHHFQLYDSRPRSYKELPVRYAELADLFRYEKSGELSGLMRVRMFCLADAHIIATREQATDEINGVLDLIEYINQTFGMVKGVDFRYRLSLGNREDTKKYFKDDASWDHAEEILRSVLKARQAPFYEAADEAAFYGPKIDVQIKNVLGKEETAFTCQYDFVMPKRFELTYIDSAGSKIEPIVIHRSSVGAFERTMAFLIEHFGGAFPLWLSPVQVALLPISENELEYTKSVALALKKEGIRVEIDESANTLGKKMVNARNMKVPYMAILGKQEVENKTITLKNRASEQITLNLDETIAKLKQEIVGKV
ncbi:MAG: threonine--tRNA ligase [Microgenomates group bacterium]